MLWAGQTVSRLGDSIFTIALASWVPERTNSAAAMGAVLVCTSLPRLFLLLVGGVVVDRLPRLALLLAADLLRGVVVLVIAAVAATGMLALWHLYALGAVLGLAAAFFFPAYTAAIPELLPPELLPSASSLRSISLRLAGVIGPAAGGVIVANGGSSLAFALDGLSFLASAACIAAGGPATKGSAAYMATVGRLSEIRRRGSCVHSQVGT
jgi:MFS family permease